MKIRSKLAFIILPIILISIVLMNIMFGMFFENYVVAQKTNQIDILKENFDSFLAAKESKYLGNINDWAHWNDTLLFAESMNPDYETNNLMESTFTNLDISFFILTDNNRNIKYKRYYSFENNEFSNFPADFPDDIRAIINTFTNNDDNYGIIQIGGDYYFTAASEITDSVGKQRTDGKLIFGRIIDSDIIGEIEKITQCRFLSIKTVTSQATGDKTVIKSENNKNNENIKDIQLYIPSPDIDSSVTIDFIFERELFSSGKERVISFSIINTAISIAIGIVIIIILWRFLSSPFTKVIEEVRKINLAKDSFERLPEVGRDEFYYLRKTINHMLGRIETVRNELRDSEKKLHATLSSVGDGIIAVDKDSKVQFLNPEAERLTGWKMQEAFNQPMDVVFVAIDEYTQESLNVVKMVCEKEDIVEFSNHTVLVSKEGTQKPIENIAAPIRNSNGDVFGCVFVFRDVSERREKQRRIEYLSYHDQLTGVYNRRYFQEVLQRLDTVENLPLSLLYIDVNGLKTINDAFGHQTGDRFIQRISDVFVKQCRPDDIIARTGGDEFAILLPKTNMAGAEKIADKIQRKVMLIKVMDIEISVSIGWDTKSTPGQDTYEVIRRAEDVMYRKKIFSSTTKRNGIIQSIMNALLVKNPREEAHSKRVSNICAELGKAYLLKDDEIKELKVSGALHDIGKIAIDDMVLNKEGRLSESERAQIQKHPETGYRLLGTSIEFTGIAEYILAHHERWDGAGYPRGLKGDDIPWRARIIAIADSYDAMTSDRPYRKALSKEDAIEELLKNAGSQFDPDIVQIFIKKVVAKL